MLDDNAFNSFFSILVSIDKKFSARDLLATNDKVAPFLDMLTTTFVGTVLPQFTEDYGQNRKLDLVLTPSHDIF